MSLINFDLNRDVTSAAVISKTNFEIEGPTAATNRSIAAFVMEATSTGFLVNAQDTTTTTPLSSAFRNISNYFFSSSAANAIPVAQNNVSTTGIARVITIGRETVDDAILSGSVTGTFAFGTTQNKIIIDVPETTISGSVGQKGDLVEKQTPTNIVGTIFYDTGTMVFHGGSTDDTNFLASVNSGFQFATNSTTTTGGTIAISKLSFTSLNLIKRTMFFTRAFNKEFNYTNNPTSTSNAVDGTISANLTGNPLTFITTVGLYNQNNELLAVAKTSPPVKKDFSTEKIFNIRLQY